jgi:2-dehydro-3-deoxyphosphogluconate aldolase/(4S)-4-hydroxy-2-oxoglutarate aldolase
MISTGCVSVTTAKEFLEAGAFALGVGGDLADTQVIVKGTPQIITEKARQYRSIIQEFRSRVISA